MSIRWVLFFRGPQIYNVGTTTLFLSSLNLRRPCQKATSCGRITGWMEHSRDLLPGASSRNESKTLPNQNFWSVLVLVAGRKSYFKWSCNTSLSASSTKFQFTYCQSTHETLVLSPMKLLFANTLLPSIRPSSSSLSYSMTSLKSLV